MRVGAWGGTGNETRCMGRVWEQSMSETRNETRSMRGTGNGTRCMGRVWE